MLDRRAPHRAEAADHHIEMSHTVGPAIRFSNSSEGGRAFATAKERPPQIKSGPAFAGTAVPWVFAGIRRAMPIGRYKVAILADIATVKSLRALIVHAALCAFGPCDFAVAAVVPLPRPRPVEISPVPSAQEATPEEAPAPSACRLRLTAELAVAPSLPALAGPGECAVDDVVRLEAVRLADKRQVAVTPPAILRCSFAEAIVHWVREDVVPAVRSLGGAIKSIDNYAAYDCRGRNRIVGARLSEHGKANALDIRSFKLANGTVVELTDPTVPKDFRERLRKDTCARFSTVLGPGSDGYHENHVHVDLAERAGGHRMCQWDVREPGDEVAQVPLPRPRPASATP